MGVEFFYQSFAEENVSISAHFWSEATGAVRMSQKILLIYNPKAGKGLFVQKLADVIDMFVKAGYRVEVHPTQKRKDAVDIARNAGGFIDMIVAAGGDGTLDEVVTGITMSGRDLPIGYIPVGSTNDYAASLNMSTSILEATGDIVGGEPQAVDIHK